MRNTKTWILALIAILIAFIGLAIVYILDQTQEQTAVAPVKITNLSKHNITQEDQKFIGIMMDVTNVSSRTVKNFTAVITVYTPQGDSINYTVIHLKPIPPDTTETLLNTFEYNELDPIQKEVYNTPSEKLRFKAKVTEFEQ